LARLWKKTKQWLHMKKSINCRTFGVFMYIISRSNDNENDYFNEKKNQLCLSVNFTTFKIILWKSYESSKWTTKRSPILAVRQTVREIVIGWQFVKKLRMKSRVTRLGASCGDCLLLADLWKLKK
jgi:hypothetical protein